MKNYTLFNYEYLFCDHFKKVSNQAKLYYIKLNFFANNGFVPNPLEVLDSLKYPKSVLDELIQNEEILTIPDRCEVFIAAYFVHNPGIKCYSWRATPYAVYWEDKLYVKKNGIIQFKPEGLPPKDEKDPLDKIIVASEPEQEVYNENAEPEESVEPEEPLPELSEDDVIKYIKGEN